MRIPKHGHGISRPIVLWILAFACLCVASAFYLKSGRAQRFQQTQSLTADLYNLGQEQFKPLSMTPISEVGAPTLLRSLWETAPVSGAEPGKAARSAVVNAVSDFLVARFGGDVDQYIAYRVRNGATFRTLLDARDMMLPSDYKDMTGTEWRDGISVEEAFRNLWNAYASNNHKGGVLTGISRDRKGLAIHFSSMTEFAQNIEPPSSEILPEVWRGVTGGCFMSWFVYEKVPAELARNGNVVNYATVAFVAEFTDGSRHPLAMTVLEVPGTGVWRVQHFCAWNSPSRRFVGMPF